MTHASFDDPAWSLLFVKEPTIRSPKENPMKHRKHVSDAVIAANRENGKHGGPRTKAGKERSSRNACRHRIFAKIHLTDPKDRKEFRRILKRWTREFRPDGTLETYLVDDITKLSWRLGITEDMEIKELLRRRESEDDDDLEYSWNDKMKLPVDNWELPTNRGWDCEQVIVRATSGDEKGDSDHTTGPAVLGGKIFPDAENVSGYRKHHAQRMEVQAVIGGSLERLSRYRSALKRELYRAIDKLLATQASR